MRAKYRRWRHPPAVREFRLLAGRPRWRSAVHLRAGRPTPWRLGTRDHRDL